MSATALRHGSCVHRDSNPVALSSERRVRSSAYNPVEDYPIWGQDSDWDVKRKRLKNNVEEATGR